MTDKIADKYLVAYDFACKSEDKICELAVFEIVGPRFTSGSKNYEDNRKKVQKWWADHRTILKSHLCKENLEFLFAPSETVREKALIIAAVADCLTGVALGISPITAATLAVTFGLRNLCGA